MLIVDITIQFSADHNGKYLQDYLRTLESNETIAGGEESNEYASAEDSSLEAEISLDVSVTATNLGPTDMVFEQPLWELDELDIEEDKLMYPGATITQEDGLQVSMKLRNDCKISDKAFGKVLQAVDQLLPDNQQFRRLKKDQPAVKRKNSTMKTCDRYWRFEWQRRW